MKNIRLNSIYKWKVKIKTVTAANFSKTDAVSSRKTHISTHTFILLATVLEITYLLRIAKEKRKRHLKTQESDKINV